MCKRFPTTETANLRAARMQQTFLTTIYINGIIKYAIAPLKFAKENSRMMLESGRNKPSPPTAINPIAHRRSIFRENDNGPCPSQNFQSDFQSRHVDLAIDVCDVISAPKRNLRDYDTLLIEKSHMLHRAKSESWTRLNGDSLCESRTERFSAINKPIFCNYYATIRGRISL